MLSHQKIKMAVYYKTNKKRFCRLLELSRHFYIALELQHIKK
jgi:hypothetical protein